MAHYVFWLPRWTINEIECIPQHPRSESEFRVLARDVYMWALIDPLCAIYDAPA